MHDWVEDVVGKLERKRSRGRGTFKILRAFDRLGPIAAHAEASLFRNGTLTVVVEDPTWLTELGFLKEELVTKIGQLAGDGAPRVEEVRIRLGKFERKRKPIVPVEERPLDAENEARLTEWAKTIGDEDLQKQFKKAVRLALRR